MTAISEQGENIAKPSEAEIKAAEAKAAEAKRLNDERMGIAISDFFKHALPYTVFDAGKAETIDLHPNRHQTRGELISRLVKIDDVESVIVEVRTEKASPQAHSVQKPLSKLRRTASAVGLALLGEL